MSEQFKLTSEDEAVLSSQDDYKYGFHDDVKSIIDTGKGISEEVVRQISAYKHEPEWMTEKRVEAYNIFMKKPMPKWGPDLSEIDSKILHIIVRYLKKQKRVGKKFLKK